MRKFARIIALLLATIMVFSFIGCNKNDPSDEEQPDDKDKEEEEVYNPYPYEDLSKFFDMPNYKNLSVSKKEIESYTEKSLSSMYQKEKLYVELTDMRSVQKWDMVNIDFVGFLGTETFEGGTGKNYDLVIGSDAFVPGFEDGIIGMTLGEVKDIDLTFPENYYENLAGKEVTFKVTINKISTPPELTEEMCKKYTNCENREELYSVIEREFLEDFATGSLLKGLELKDYPAEHNDYYQSFVEYFTQYAVSQAMNLSEFIKTYGSYFSNYGLYNGMGITQFYAVAKEYADECTLMDLLMYTIIRNEGLKTEGPEYEAAAKVLEKNQGKTIAELEKSYGKIQIITSVMSIQMYDKLLSYITITD